MGEGEGEVEGKGWGLGWGSGLANLRAGGDGFYRGGRDGDGERVRRLPFGLGRGGVGGVAWWF